MLFCDESGGVMAFGTIRNRLAYLQQLEDAPVEERFSPHALRRACATRNYERGVDLVAIQQMLGHWHVGTTMRYVQPSSTFVEDAYVRAISDTLAELEQRGGLSMEVRWKLRMAAAQREVWTGAQLRRLLAERAGVEMSAASVSALMRQAPKQLKLSTLQALCVALDCQPGELIEVDTTPVAKPARGGKPARQQRAARSDALAHPAAVLS